MSTNAIIKVEGIDYVQLYKHWDGYPEATQQWLEDFNQKFTKNRGDDPYYKIAQLVRSSIKDSEKYELDDSEFTGWGLLPFGADAGQEYEYILKADDSVTVIKV